MPFVKLLFHLFLPLFYFLPSLFCIDHLLKESEDIRILQEGGRHSLIIAHVTSEDEGFFTVTARNNHGEAESSAELYIQEPRPAISSQM